MTFEEYIAATQGKHVEEGGSSNAINQCVDLANGYLVNVLGQPKVLGTNAIDFPARIGNKFEWIPYTQGAVPIRGDIVIWKPTPGHIAMFIEGDKNRFSSFDQNFPVGSKAHKQEHTYQNVTGWLRYKGVTMLTYRGLDLDNREAMKVTVDVWARLQAGELIDKSKYLSDVELAKSQGYANGLEDGKKQSLTPAQPPKVIPVNGENWHLNGIIWDEGKLKGNYYFPKE
jgi:hypothetical protein